jgi:hypothetical protein
VDAEHWLTDYRDRLTDIGVRARRAQEALAGAAATETSRDGAVTATVDAGGGLRSLVLSERSAQMGRAELAAAIVATAASARRRAAEGAIAAVTPLLGADSPAVRMIRENLPPEPAPPTRGRP